MNNLKNYLKRIVSINNFPVCKECIIMYNNLITSKCAFLKPAANVQH